MSEPKHRIVLGSSYRLPYAVWSYAERWIKQVGLRVEKPYRPLEDAIDGEVRQISASSNRPMGIISEVERLLQEEDGDVMILSGCGYILLPTLKALKARALPFHNPFRRKRSDWNPLARGVRTVKATDRVIAFAQSSPELMEKPVPQTWKSLHAWIDHLSADTLPRGLKATISKRAKDLGDEIVKYSVMEELLGSAVTRHLESGNLEWLHENTLESHRGPLDMAMKVAQARGVKALLEEPRITVGTIHSVKGGEASTVILLPDLSPASYQGYSIGSGPLRDDVIRCFYVGLTRAKRRVLLASGSARTFRVSWLDDDVEPF